jgi:drug/metabolite transporter (DMT)-like permease
VVVVVWPGLTAAGRVEPLSPPGVLACLVALAAGTVGTVYQKRYGTGVPMLWGTAVQYAAAAGVLLAGAVATERMTIRWTGEFVVAMAWLVLVLSLGAVLLLLLLLRRGTAAEVSSLYYLVPPAVALEAWLLFGTVPAAVSVAGIALTVLGVALVVAPRRRPAPVG